MNRMSILERQQENLVESANQSIFYLQQQISGLETEISDLKQQIEAYHPTEETEAETVDNENIENTEEQHELTSDELGEVNFPENSGEKITEENENE